MRAWSALGRCVGAMLLAAAMPSPAGAQAPAQPAAAATPVSLTLDQAIDLALQRNHALLAARTTIQQNQAQEVTANLRPNPVFLGDLQFLPIFSPSNFTSDYLENSAQFDLG